MKVGSWGIIRSAMPPQRILLSALLSFSLVCSSMPALAQAPSKKTKKPSQPVAETIAVGDIIKERPAQRRARLARERTVAAKITELMADENVARGFWGIHVVSLTSGRTLFELNQDK